MKHQSRLDNLMIAINKWLDTPKISRSIMCSEVVRAVEVLGLSAVLEKEGITFNKSSDAFNDMRVNAQKLFRWLGQYEGQHAFPDRLFHLEQSIVAAMPEHIKIDYLNSIYSMVNVTISPKPLATTSSESKQEIISNSIKESSEAHVATLGIDENSSDEEILAAIKENEEAAVASTNAVGFLKKLMANRSPAKVLKAVS